MRDFLNPPNGVMATEQSQRGSNPCLHLERAERIVEARPSRSQGMSFWQVKTAILDDR